VTLIIAGISAQNFSRTYNPNLPIAYWTLLGMPPLAANKLFIAANFQDDGSTKTVCESTSNSNGTFTGNLLYTTGGQRVMRVNISLRSDTTGDFNYIIGITITNLMSGQTSALTYNGTEQSAGQMVGAC
jgi:hypothetical protein